MISCTQFNKLLHPIALTNNTPLPAELTAATTNLIPLKNFNGFSSLSADRNYSEKCTIAMKLGVNNPADLHTARFKVDREKLVQMIKMESGIKNQNGAEFFFDNIMKITKTDISWPADLIVDARIKRDPHIGIVGRIENVQRAKECIVANLRTRVTMKMNISYTDHRYIIGRGGIKIKYIMDDTSVFIHFPDSNRSTSAQKSNEVSLNGYMEDVESARHLMRLSTPLLISFQVPVMANNRQQLDYRTQYIKILEITYNIEVILSTYPNSQTVLVQVRGFERQASQVMEATEIMASVFNANSSNQILVTMQMNISPKDHSVVKGYNNFNLLSIMERTQTKIIFPNPGDMNVNQQSQVTISGTIESVYKARQQLLGNLPITIIFDLPGNHYDQSMIMNLRLKYGVYILLRQKRKENIRQVIIKGVEKFLHKIYEARHEILGLTSSICKPIIPDSYFMPEDKNLSLVSHSVLTEFLVQHYEQQQHVYEQPTVN